MLPACSTIPLQNLVDSPHIMEETLCQILEVEIKIDYLTQTGHFPLQTEQNLTNRNEKKLAVFKLCKTVLRDQMGTLASLRQARSPIFSGIDSP